MIDANWGKYPEELLHNWKKEAENRANRDLTHPMTIHDESPRFNPSKGNDIKCIQNLINNGGLYQLPRLIYSLPKIADLRVFELYDILNEFILQPNV